MNANVNNDKAHTEFGSFVYPEKQNRKWSVDATGDIFTEGTTSGQVVAA